MFLYVGADQQGLARPEDGGCLKRDRVERPCGGQCHGFLPAQVLFVMFPMSSSLELCRHCFLISCCPSQGLRSLVSRRTYEVSGHHKKSGSPSSRLHSPAFVDSAGCLWSQLHPATRGILGRLPNSLVPRRKGQHLDLGPVYPPCKLSAMGCG